MMSGLPPFYDGESLHTMNSNLFHSVSLTPNSENTDKMYEKIIKNPLLFTENIFGPEAKSILKGLLTREPSNRLGTKGADEIKRHPFFAKVRFC
jgi:serum/glucocorticoid-regulated kinase 2